MLDASLQDILKRVYTKAELHGELDTLRMLAERRVFGGRESGEEIPDTSAWDESVLESFTAENIYERMNELRCAADALPSLVIYVPVAFSRAEVIRIGTWCRTNIAPSVLLELLVDPAVVGGCALVLQSKRHDLTLRHFAAKHHRELVELVKRYGA